MSIYFLPIFLLALLFSMCLTNIVRHYAIRKTILDIPNERSSHQIPIPRGGGVSIAIISCLSILTLGFLNFLEPRLVLALAGGGILVAAIGYGDDVYSIKVRWRFLAHFVASSWAVYWLGGFPILDLGSIKLSLHWIGSLFAVAGIIWCINFYNFMDGIDGLAGTEGVFIGIAASVPLYIAGEYHLAFLLWILSAAIAGFLFWNWLPAKIFMGDTGSGFLGFIFAVIALYTVNQSFISAAFWFIIVGVFASDATFTLIHRIYKKKSWYIAHREHAYQHLVSLGIDHSWVTLSILFFNLFILCPIALSAIYWPQYTIWFISITIISLWLLWFGIRCFCFKKHKHTK